MEKNLLSETEKLAGHSKIFIKRSFVVKCKADYLPKHFFFALGKRVKNSVTGVCEKKKKS